MRKLISHIIASTVGLWLVALFVAGVRIKLSSDSSFFGLHLTAPWQLFVLLGIILGLLSYFIKPILDTITLPLRFITLGLFSLVTMMALVWVLDAMFAELTVPLWLPLLYTSLIIWVLGIAISHILVKKEE